MISRKWCRIMAFYVEFHIHRKCIIWECVVCKVTVFSCGLMKPDILVK